MEARIVATLFVTLSVITSSCKMFSAKPPPYMFDESYVYFSGDDRSLLNLKSHALLKQKYEIEYGKIDPDDGDKIKLMKLAFALGKYDDLESYGRKALIDGRNRDEVFLLLAATAIRQNRISLAHRHLEQVQDKRFMNKKLNLEAMVHYYQNAPSLAVENLIKAYEREPNNFATAMNLGLMYLDLRMMKSAEEHFTRMTKKFINGYDAKLHLAIVQKTIGKNQEARKHLEELAEIFPENTLIRRHLNTLPQPK